MFPATLTRTVLFGATCWTASVVFFASQAIAQAASTRPYSDAANLISDLGNTACGPAVCSPLHDFVNVTFVLTGLLQVVGAVTTFRAWPRPLANAAGILMLAVAGLGLSGAGVFPENGAPGVHAGFALAGLICLNVAMILIGSALARRVRWLGVSAYVAGIVGFIGFGMFMNRPAGVPIGIAERIADYPGAAMVVVLGAFILASAVRRPEPARLPGDRLG